MEPPHVGSYSSYEIPKLARAVTTCFLLLLFACGLQASSQIFTNSSDVGQPARAGSVRFDPKTGICAISGGGANMWFTNDAFQFVWVRMSGDLRLSADVRWPGTTGDPHRKACLMIRQSLAPDSAYADAAVHGNGLTSLQSRGEDGETTMEVQSALTSPRRVAIEKHGDYCFMLVSRTNEDLQPAGGSFKVSLKEPFYVGLTVCAHNNAKLETATFSNVVLQTLVPETSPTTVISTLETISASSGDRRVLYQRPERFEAPNWSRDGKFLVFNCKGLLYSLPLAGGEPKPIDTGSCRKCNNDHGFSPDGKNLAISDGSEVGKSLIYIVSSAGSAPRRITATGPSYWHGWSPDGKTLAFCGERNGEFDIYTIPAAGGPESRLTTTPGLDDGPDYSPDGKYIYFNSERSGFMQIWRMRANGDEQRPLTSDDYNNWFPHPSPDGKWLAFLSYDKTVKGHPENKDVLLRLMPANGGTIRILTRLFGGQGTINVPSWSPDSKTIAFVSYIPKYASLALK